MLACRSCDHSTSSVLPPRLWSLDPTSPIHPTPLLSNLGPASASPSKAYTYSATS